MTKLAFAESRLKISKRRVCDTTLAALDGESAAVLTIDDPSAAPADFSGVALRAQIARSGPRFAMILDSSLRCRRTLSYRSHADLLSPLELIGWAVALRQRDHGGESLVRGAPLPAPDPAGCGERRALLVRTGRPGLRRTDLSSRISLIVQRAGRARVRARCGSHESGSLRGATAR